MVGAGGLEPLTSSVSGRRSNQLSYAPVCREFTRKNEPPVYKLRRTRGRGYRKFRRECEAGRKSWGELLSPPNFARRTTALPDGFLERLPRAEADDAALGNLDGGAGLRVASRTRFTLGRLERTEPDECDRVTLLQRPRDSVDHRIQRGGRTRLRGAG